MKIELEPTGQLVSLNGQIMARLWKGRTDRGFEVHAIIPSIVCVSDSAENARMTLELHDIPPLNYTY